MIETFLIGGLSMFIVALFFYFPKEAFAILIVGIIGVFIFDSFEQKNKFIKKNYEGTYYEARTFNINGEVFNALAEKSYNIQMGGGIVENSEGIKFPLASDPIRRCDFYNNVRNDKKIVDRSRAYSVGDVISVERNGSTEKYRMPKSAVERCILFAEIQNIKDGIYLIR